MRALERAIIDADAAQYTSRTKYADAIERNLRDELVRDPSGLRDLGLEPATLQDEDGDYIECWVFIL